MAAAYPKKLVVYYNKALAGTVVNMSAGAGRLIRVDVLNTTAAVAYLQLFDLAAASVTLGTTAPRVSYGIPASGTLSLLVPKGLEFDTRISAAGTTTADGLTAAALAINALVL